MSNLKIPPNGNIGIGTTTLTGSSNIAIGSSALFTVSTSGTSYFSTKPSVVYNILGEDVEVEGYRDPNVSVIIASINVLGKIYYDELIKQGLQLPSEITSFLELKFKIQQRDDKIKSIIDK